MQQAIKETLKKELPGEIFELMEIDLNIPGFQTQYTFKKAVLDKDFIWELSLDLGDMPTRLYLHYKVHILLDPSASNSALKRLVDEYRDPQKNLLRTDEEVIEKMKKIHEEYWKESRILGDYIFDTQLSKMENKNTSTLNFLVKMEDVQTFERLKHTAIIGRTCIILQNSWNDV